MNKICLSSKENLKELKEYFEQYLSFIDSKDIANLTALKTKIDLLIEKIDENPYYKLKDNFENKLFPVLKDMTKGFINSKNQFLPLANEGDLLGICEIVLRYSELRRRSIKGGLDNYEIIHTVYYDPEKNILVQDHSVSGYVSSLDISEHIDNFVKSVNVMVLGNKN